MNKALLDTDILSEIGKAKDANVAAHPKTYRRSFGHYTLSTVSVMEIISGFQRTQATARLNAFLATLPHMELLPFDRRSAELAGRIAGDIENGIELVTGNTSDFQRVLQVGYLLTLVNWRN